MREPARRDRLRALSAVGFWFLVPVWVVCCILTWRQGAAGLPIGVIVTARPETAGAYPEVLGALVVQFAPPDAAPVRGDRLLRFGDADLRGLGPAPVVLRAWRARTVVADGYAMPLTYLHEGVARATTARYPRNPFLRWFAIIALIEGGLAILVRRRAGDRQSGRTFSLAAILHALVLCNYMGGSDAAVYAFSAVSVTALFLLGPQALRCVLVVPEETAPTSRWPYWAIWVAALPALLYWQGLWGWKLLPPERCYAIAQLAYAGLCLVGFAIVVRSYVLAGPTGRRQLRWALFGLALAVPAVVAAGVLAAVNPRLTPWMPALHLLSLASPVSVAIAIVRANLFDIDRVISVAAAYAASLFILLAGGLAGLPPLATWMATALQLDPGIVQLMLGLAIASLAMLAQPYVRPWIDRLFFKERYALERGIAHLLRDLGACDGPEAVLVRVGEALDTLLRPEACVVYGLASDCYRGVFMRGRTMPPTVEPGSPLVAALERLPGPLARERWSEARRRPALGAFERATLETLGAEIVVPANRGRLLAFACLGAKRSGDLFTSTDLALLAAVGDKIASELARFQLHDRVAEPFVAEAAGGTPQDLAALNGQVFQRTGDFWLITFEGATIQLRDTRGLRYLAELLHHPGREFHASELVSATRSPANGNGAPAGALELVVASDLGDAGTVLDARASREYRARLAELREERETAARLGDHARAERAGVELEALTHQLAGAVRSRRAASHGERARLTVTKGIGAALEKISTSHPALGRHLGATVKRGYFCSYNPDPRVPMRWHC